MKLQFDAKLPFQQEAIESAVNLFAGQTPNQANFTVCSYSSYMGQTETETGIGNWLELKADDILDNLRNIQLKNGLPQSKSLAEGKLDFDVEMETGTGKTYVYLRTIFELNKAYGFTKFIIVVPSLAIKEGVYKSLQITEEHFRGLYDNARYDYFVYDSSKLEQVRSFAINDYITIMVINIDAFRKSFESADELKKSNIIHRPNDSLNGMKPITLLQETRPFLIIDEPQSVDTTPRAKEAISSLCPLCIFRYSATHVEKHNLIYKLDAIDSYERGLVKQIEVASFAARDYHNKAYTMLKSVSNATSPITAKIELDVELRGTVKRTVKTVKKGDLLEELTHRDIYSDYIIDEINCTPGEEFVTFTANDIVLRINQPQGDVNPLKIKENQIAKTIEEHLDKELYLRKQGVKVLSLFFIDKVANYRYYDENGIAQKGPYAQMFEQQYKRIIKRQKYATLFHDVEIETPVEQIHDGYFSVDKKGKAKDTNGKTSEDECAYNLIMKNKERLLSFDSPLRFIFSHSALREGWDNPNVFQICTLNDTKSEIKKRQEIGRGLRLCVNQSGARQHDSSMNILTVMANESYEEFASKLQQEYEKDEGIRFGYLQEHSFASIVYKAENGETGCLGEEKSRTLFQFFQENSYIDAKGKIQDELREALKQNQLSLPEDFQPQRISISAVCRKAAGNLNIKNAAQRREVKLNKEVYLSEDFQALWDRIKHKTTYQVEFDCEKMIARCANEMSRKINSPESKLIYTKAKISVSRSGVKHTESARQSVSNAQTREELPDIIMYLQNRTRLTRRSIVQILTRSETLEQFNSNPQRYMEDAAKIILDVMQNTIIDGIKYTKIGNEEYFAQQLFENAELIGYLEKNMLESKKSVYNYVVYDSGVEREFARQMENNEEVKLFAKLPRNFTVSTPLGKYNPDWAVLIERCSNNDTSERKLYFVIETKGNTLTSDLRPTEMYKIRCGMAHFQALGEEITFNVANNFESFIESVEHTKTT